MNRLGLGRKSPLGSNELKRPAQAGLFFCAAVNSFTQQARLCVHRVQLLTLFYRVAAQHAFMKAGSTPPLSQKTTRRRGRPPSEQAGLVEARVLEVATQLFLEQGFGRTTLDKVSQLSGTGKSALYARYSDKGSLFTAVVERSIFQMFAGLSRIPQEGSTKDRLLQVGINLAESLLVPRCVAFMRITAAEAANFPELAKMAYHVSFEGAVRCVMEALCSNDFPADAQQTRATAERFVELALQPVSFQAAFGSDFTALRDRCQSDVLDAILLLEAKGLL